MVTLGLPAFNEARHLELAVCSVLNQSYTDFELILADNASTDGTLALMRRLAAADSRIRVLPSVRNMGQLWNFRRLLDEARGEYFAWIGAHDAYDRLWLESLVAMISSDERLVLVFPKVKSYLPDMTLLRETAFPFDSRNMRIEERLWKFPAMQGAGERIYGLLRTNAARGYPVRGTLRWDVLYLAGLSLLGDAAYVDRAVWYRRVDRIPRKDSQFVEAALARQLRSLFPQGEPPLWKHRLASFYHVFALLRDGYAVCLRRGFGIFRGLTLVGIAAASLGTRSHARLEIRMLFRRGRASNLPTDV